MLNPRYFAKHCLNVSGNFFIIRSKEHIDRILFSGYFQYRNRPHKRLHDWRRSWDRFVHKATYSPTLQIVFGIQFVLFCNSFIWYSKSWSSRDFTGVKLMGALGNNDFAIDRSTNAFDKIRGRLKVISSPSFI